MLQELDIYRSNPLGNEPMYDQRKLRKLRRPTWGGEQTFTTVAPDLSCGHQPLVSMTKTPEGISSKSLAATYWQAHSRTLVMHRCIYMQGLGCCYKKKICYIEVTARPVWLEVQNKDDA